MSTYRIGDGRGRHKQQWNKEPGMANISVEHDVDGHKIIVIMPYDEDAKEELKTKFAARWNPDDKVWSIDAHDYDIDEVRKEVAVHFKDYRP